jgi:hypothetical protein
LEESCAIGCAEQEVGVTISVQVLPGSEAQITYTCETDLDGALFEVAITSVLVVARLVLFVDDEEVE